MMRELFDNLMDLCKNSDCFYYKDVTTSMLTECRFFAYRFIPAFSAWLEPDAIESRGILFEMKNGEPISILARPMAKFFNLNENNLTKEENLDLETAEIYAKEDGSLVSIFKDKDTITCKTIASLFSDQATAANSLLHSDKYKEFYKDCVYFTNKGYTVNCEYVAPDNQIVLQYRMPELIVLNIRDNKTGEYLDIKGNYFNGQNLQPLDKTYSPELYNEENIEGYVLVLNTGQRIKIKTNWYVNLHRIRSAINSDSNIIESIIDGEIDDVIPLLVNSPALKRKIEITTEYVSKTLFEYFQKVVKYHEENKYKTKKDYAIGFNLPRQLMNPTMKLYDNTDEESIIGMLKDHMRRFSSHYAELLDKSGMLDELKSDKYGNIE